MFSFFNLAVSKVWQNIPQNSKFFCHPSVKIH